MQQPLTPADLQDLERVEAWLFDAPTHEPVPPRAWVVRETIYTLRRLVDASRVHQTQKCPRARAEVVRLLALLEGLAEQERPALRESHPALAS